MRRIKNMHIGTEAVYVGDKKRYVSIKKTQQYIPSVGSI